MLEVDKDGYGKCCEPCFQYYFFDIDIGRCLGEPCVHADELERR